MIQGSIGSMIELGVTESYKLKRQVVLSASEAAEMILRYDTNRILNSKLTDWMCRVDDILRATPRRREAT
jgi:T-complex protein 1 subunit beta